MTQHKVRLSSRQFDVAFAIALLLAGFPLVAAITSMLDVVSTPFAIAVRGMLFAMCGLFFLYNRHAPPSVKGRYILILALVFWLFYIIRMVNDLLFSSYFDLFFEPYLYWLWGLGVSFGPMLAMMLVNYRDRNAFTFFKWALVATVLAILFAIPNISTFVGEGNETYSGGRAQLAALNPISLGHLGVQAIILGISGFLVQRWHKSLFWIGLLILAILSGLYLSLVANSRGPIVSMIVVIAVLIFASNYRGKYAIIGVASVLMLFIVPLVQVVDQFAGTAIYDRMFGQSQLDDINTIGRIDIYSSAWNAFLTKPLTGSGLEDPVFGGYPHNLVLEAFMTTGILGGLVFLALLLLSLVTATLIARDRPNYSWVALLAVQQIIGSLFSGSLAQAGVMWALIGMVAALSATGRPLNLTAAKRSRKMPITANSAAFSQLR